MAITGAWEEALRGEFRKPYYAELYKTVLNEYRTQTVYPPSADIFNAFQFTPLEQVKVVILGQDPYHEPGQAHGLAFSVPEGVRLPPSLRNIYKELEQDLGCSAPQSGDLRFWAEQGVLLLNTTLTVAEGRAGSHSDMGWQAFTDAVVESLGDIPHPVAFVLWGACAAKKAAAAGNSPHPRLVLTGPHPSPLSAYRGFFGCRHFSKCNAFLEKNGLPPIDWQIENLAR